MLTKGEYRVGIGFNPSADDMVARIKSAAAGLIDLIESLPSDRESEVGNERGRLKALAQTEIESAAMWAVKAATKRPADIAPTETMSGTNAMAVKDDQFHAIVRAAIREYRSIPRASAEVGATDFVRAALKKQGFLSVSGDDIDEAILKVDEVAA